MAAGIDFVILGLSLTSSWGNGHATTYRHLVRGLRQLGHQVTFLERDVPWYAEHRDPIETLECEVLLYESLGELRCEHDQRVQAADVVIVGSYVPEGPAVGDWVFDTARGLVAFYDIDTPVTLASLARGECPYLSLQQLAAYDLYLSFSGGPALNLLAGYGAKAPRALYCSVDERLYAPQRVAPQFDFGYMGTYSPDRQTGLEELLIGPASRWPEGRFTVAGSRFPADVPWPGNVTRFEHVPPQQHVSFYCSQRATLNLTRAEMRQLGYAPSIRLFEAAACGTPIISDRWPGLDDLFQIGRELMVADSGQQVLDVLREMADEDLKRMGQAARERVLAAHTGLHRARELEQHLQSLGSVNPSRVAG